MSQLEGRQALKIFPKFLSGGVCTLSDSRSSTGQSHHTAGSNQVQHIRLILCQPACCNMRQGSWTALTFGLFKGRRFCCHSRCITKVGLCIQSGVYCAVPAGLLAHGLHCRSGSTHLTLRAWTSIRTSTCHMVSIVTVCWFSMKLPAVPVAGDDGHACRVLSLTSHL